MDLILASSSRYRRSQLRELGFRFTAESPDVDETQLPNETPEQLVRRLARLKSATVANRYQDAAVIGADQVAVVGDEILTKPLTTARAFTQLQRLSNSTVVFLSAVAVTVPAKGLFEFVEPTTVIFRALTDSEITNYIDLDQPLDCAGAIKSESRGPLLFKEVRSNDPSALIGLPLIKLAQVLREAGINPLA